MLAWFYEQKCFQPLGCHAIHWAQHLSTLGLGEALSGEQA